MSGYRVTIAAFLPADPNDPRDIVQAGTILAELQTYLPEDLVGVEIRHQFVARHKIDYQAARADAAASEGPLAMVAKEPPTGDSSGLTSHGTDPAVAGAGTCKHDWVSSSDNSAARHCTRCGVMDDLLDLTGTALDRRARA